MIRMLIILFSSILIFFYISVYATDIPEGNLNTQTWTKTGSPYYIQGNVTIPFGSTLTIDQGVEVFFQGDYIFEVLDGTLLANGIANDSIYFHQDPAYPSRWGGIRLRRTSSSILSYCCIEDGYADLVIGADNTNTVGGGVRMMNCSPTIENCSFSNNYADIHGGAISIIGDSHPLIENCTIQNNTANVSGGGIYVDGENASTGPTPTIRYNNINHNNAHRGGGVFLNIVKYPMVFADNIISHNNANSGNGGGLLVYICPGDVIVENNIFQGNSAAALGGGFYLFRLSNKTIRNNIFYDNHASYGGAICSAATGPGIIYMNNTIFQNTASQRGGGIRIEAPNPPTELSNASFSNCILWDNTAAESTYNEINVESDGSTISIDYSDIEGGYSGTGNINNEPHFINSSGLDFHLAENSPCIDVGTSVNAPAADYDGNPTGQDGNNDDIADYDMGAFEFLQKTNAYTIGDNQDFSVSTFVSDPQQIAAISFNNLTHSGDVQVICYTKSFPLNSPTGSYAVHRWYRIVEKEGIIYSGATLKLFYSNVELALSGLSGDNLTLWKHENGSWVNKGGTVNTNENSVTVSGINNLDGDWAFADLNDHTLPVQLLTFEYSIISEGIKFHWQTASELNNAGFEIWRKIPDQTEFQNISSYNHNPALTGLGSSNVGQSYEFIDKTVFEGFTYIYRIENVDFNGTHHIYRIQQVLFDKKQLAGPETFTVSGNYPNPFNPATNFDVLLGSSANVTIQLFNILGQEVKKYEFRNLSAGGSTLAVNLNQLPAGSYFYRAYVSTIGDDKNGIIHIKSGKLVLLK